MFFDFGFGVVFCYFLGWTMGFDPTVLQVAISIVFAGIVDTDAIINWIRGKDLSTHRELGHYPIWWFIGGMVLIPIDPIIAILFYGNVTMHFLHDSMDGSCGIRWIPGSRKYYRFFRNKSGEFSVHSPVLSWNYGEDASLKKEDFSFKEWFTSSYLRLCPNSIIEYSIFLFALILLSKDFLF